MSSHPTYLDWEPSRGLDEHCYEAVLQSSRAAPNRLTCPHKTRLSTGEARGANSLLWVCWMCVEIWAAVGTGVHLLQAVLVSLSVRFFPVYPAERFVLNGKAKVRLTTVRSLARCQAMALVNGRTWKTSSEPC